LHTDHDSIGGANESYDSFGMALAN
jgi:hypothetical protein